MLTAILLSVLAQSPYGDYIGDAPAYREYVGDPAIRSNASAEVTPEQKAAVVAFVGRSRDAMKRFISTRIEATPEPASPLPAPHIMQVDVPAEPKRGETNAPPRPVAVNGRGETVRLMGELCDSPDCQCENCTGGGCACGLAKDKQADAPKVALDFKPEPKKAEPPDDRAWHELGGPFAGYQGFGRKDTVTGMVTVEWSCRNGTADVRRGLPTVQAQPSYATPVYATGGCPNGQCSAATYQYQRGFFGGVFGR